MEKQILRVDASMRRNGYYSRRLADSLIQQLNQQEQHVVKIRDLADGVAFVNEDWIAANFTAASERTPEQLAQLSDSDLLVSELQNSDVIVIVIVIGLPIYNFGVPAAFKAWIDQVARVQLTFHYTNDGPVGLLENKKAYVIVASGGTQLGSDIDFMSSYVRHVLGFIGIKDVSFIDGSGIGQDEEGVLSSANEIIAAI